MVEGAAARSARPLGRLGGNRSGKTRPDLGAPRGHLGVQPFGHTRELLDEIPLFGGIGNQVVQLEVTGLEELHELEPPETARRNRRGPPGTGHARISLEVDGEVPV